MQGSGVTVVKEAGQFFPFGVLALHGRFEQRFLNVARHVTPNIHSRSSQQVCVAFLSVGHWASDMRLSRSGTADGPLSSIATTAKGSFEWDYLPKTSKPWRICCSMAFRTSITPSS